MKVVELREGRKVNLLLNYLLSMPDASVISLKPFNNLRKQTLFCYPHFIDRKTDVMRLN